MNTNTMEQEIVVVDQPQENPLVSLVKTLDAQKKAKEDYVVPADHITYNGTTGMLEVLGDESKIEQYKVSDHTHHMVGDKLEIPRGYYKRMQTAYPELLSENINGWLSRKEKTKYLLRTFNYEGQDKLVRAMLSDRYNILDNYDVLVAALEAIKNTGVKVEIVKAEITDMRMYLHVVAPEIHVEATNLLDGYLANRDTAKTGRGIISGMVLSNSEIGMGTFEISARAQILQCKNGLHDRNARFRKVHLGGRLEEGIQWSQNTKNKNYELIISQVTDSVKVYLSQDYLGKLTDKLQEYKEVKIEHPTGVIERINNELQIGEEHKNSVLRYFLQDGDESALGMLNAYTRHTQKMDPDSQYEVESGVFSLLGNMHKWDKPAGKN